MTAANERFLVGVTGLGVDPRGRVLLARHRFGAPQWRFLGGFLHRRERVEDALAREIREETGLVIEVGPVLEVVTGHRWARVELVFAVRVTGGTERLSGEVAELGWFPPEALPEVRTDQPTLVGATPPSRVGVGRAPLAEQPVQLIDHGVALREQGVVPGDLAPLGGHEGVVPVDERG